MTFRRAGARLSFWVPYPTARPGSTVLSQTDVKARQAGVRLCRGLLLVAVQLGLNLDREVPHQFAVFGAARLPHG